MNEIQGIWTNFHQDLKGFIGKTIKDPSDVDDILQDSFLKILRNQDKIGKADNLRQYVFGIVRNTINDHFRGKKIEKNKLQRDSPPITADEDRSLNTAIADCCVRPFINQLPEKYRDVLLITEFEALSQKALAERLNISYSGAKSRVQRGREKLKELLLNCCAYESDRYGNLFTEDKKDCDC